MFFIALFLLLEWTPEIFYLQRENAFQNKSIQIYFDSVLGELSHPTPNTPPSQSPSQSLPIQIYFHISNNLCLVQNK